jgi:hypothetical protein
LRLALWALDQSNQAPRFLRFQRRGRKPQTGSPEDQGSCRRASSYPSSGESEVRVTNSTRLAASRLPRREVAVLCVRAAITSFPSEIVNHIPPKGVASTS